MRYLLFTFLLAFLVACGLTPKNSRSLQGPSLETEASERFNFQQLTSLLIFPVEFNESVRQQGADAGAITNRLVDAFERRTTVEILNRSQPDIVQRALAEIGRQPRSLEDRARGIGVRVGAGGVMVGRITNYRESDGSRFGADRGAELSFFLRLLDPQSGDVLWSAHFDRREAPLSENLFRVGEGLAGGLQYRSREQLVTYGFESAANEFEKLRSD